MVVEEVSNKFCKRCHRELKDNKSKELGYGPICYKKYLQKQKVYLFEMEENKRSRNMKIEEAIKILKQEPDFSLNYYNRENAIDVLLSAYEKEKERNNRYFKQNIEYQKTLEKLQKETVWKDKIKEIIYPTPENGIPIEVQQSEIYKKLLKEVEE